MISCVWPPAGFELKYEAMSHFRDLSRFRGFTVHHPKVHKISKNQISRYCPFKALGREVFQEINSSNIKVADDKGGHFLFVHKEVKADNLRGPR